MDWNNLLCKKRFYSFEEIKADKNDDFYRNSFHKDYDRIIFSNSFRRLSKKTQVHPLSKNDHVHNRLTHSLEVASVGRSLGLRAGKFLDEKFPEIEINPYDIAYIVQTACLAHDIGNPPFGHFAEETINKWLKINILPKLESFESSTKELEDLKSILKSDICNYDGNAQAIRIITKLQRLNLSYFQIIAVLKYTRGAFENKPDNSDSLNYLKKKPGFYYSEKDLVEKIQTTLNIKAGHRFPITYIMEAADDISYLTADLEDSVEKGILSLDEVYNIITSECTKQNEEFLLEIINKQYEKAKKNDEPYQFNMFFTFLRVTLVTNFVKHVSDVFIKNHKAIFEGSFNHALLEYDKTSKYYKALKVLQDISKKHIYSNKEVQTLELQAYTIVNGLFDIYKPILELNNSDFSELLKDGKIDCFISKRLIKRISSKQIVAYKNDIKKLNTDNIEEYNILEFYYRVRLIIDYISGMTDDFALEEYKILHAIK